MTGLYPGSRLYRVVGDERLVEEPWVACHDTGERRIMLVELTDAALAEYRALPGVLSVEPAAPGRYVNDWGDRDALVEPGGTLRYVLAPKGHNGA